LILTSDHPAGELRRGICFDTASPAQTHAPVDRQVELIPGSHGFGVFPYVVTDRFGIAIAEPEGGTWHEASAASGDIVIFSGFIVHRGTPNLTSDYRLSIDFRYQPSSEPVCEPYFSKTAVVVDQEWSDVCAEFVDPSILNSIVNVTRILQPYNLDYIRQRERLVLQHGQQNDPRVISALRKVAARGTTTKSRDEATDLLSRMTIIEAKKNPR
jgi:hypothetical protein